MAPSDRFKPIQKIASNKERKAAAELGETLKTRQQAEQRLAELKQYHCEYLDRFSAASRHGIGGAQIQEYRAFIAKLEQAIDEQTKMVAQSNSECDASKAQWRGKYTKAKAMDNALERMRDNERRTEDRREQAATDERNQRRK